MKVKEESEKVGLKLNIQKTKIMASGPITSWHIDGETVETVSDFIFSLHAAAAAVASVVSNYVPPHRKQPTRCHTLWDSPGKNTGVGCHFLLQYMKVKSESEVSQLCLTLRYPMDCSPPGSSIHWIFQVRVLQWVAIAFSSTKSITQYSVFSKDASIWFFRASLPMFLKIPDYSPLFQIFS